MKTARKLKNRILGWIFSEILSNTLFTLALTAFLGGYFATRKYEDFTLYQLLIPPGIILLLAIIYFFASREKVLKRSQVHSADFLQEWVNSETRVPTVAVKTREGFLVQLMDIPIINKYELPDSYALEFRAKVLNKCFAWCVNLEIGQNLLQGYMFQYDPLAKSIRPHLLVKYDKTTMITYWVTPETANSPLEAKQGVDLVAIDGFFHVRTEVSQSTRISQAAEEIDESTKPILDDKGNVVQIDLSRKNKVVEIKIFDLNNRDKEVCHSVFSEPPFKVFTGNHFGFRNFGFESSIYKDIVVKEL